MRTLHQAREIAIQSLANCDASSFDPVLLEDKTEEMAEGWIFHYQARRFLGTDDISDSLVGNAPLFVPRGPAPPVFISYHRPVSESMEAYRACGNANAEALPGVRVRSWKTGAKVVSAIHAIRQHSVVGMAEAKSTIEHCLAGNEVTIATASVCTARQLQAHLEKHGFISVIAHDA